MATPAYTVTHGKNEHYSVVEFTISSLMDPAQLEEIAKNLYHLVDAEDRRRIVLDFEKVTYISSQAIGIIMGLRKRLGALKHSRLVLCGVGPKLAEVLRITALDKQLTIKPTQREAVLLFEI